MNVDLINRNRGLEMVEFKITPTTSKRKLAKQVMNAIEKELLTCSPNYELTIDIKIIENYNKYIQDE